MQRGYIKVWRKIEDSGLLHMPNTLALFMFMLFNAMYKDCKVGTSTGVIELKRGQYISGRKKLSTDLEQSEREIRTSLDRLVNLEILTIKTTNKYSIYTVVNYEKYQANDQQTTSTETNKRPANDQQTTTKEELKNLNIKEKTYTPLFEAFWSAYPSNRKAAKKSCAATWERKKLDRIADKIIADVKAKIVVWGEFNPAPLTYINQERWLDGAITSQQSSDELPWTRDCE